METGSMWRSFERFFCLFTPVALSLKIRGFLSTLDKWGSWHTWWKLPDTQTKGYLENLRHIQGRLWAIPRGRHSNLLVWGVVIDGGTAARGWTGGGGTGELYNFAPVLPALGTLLTGSFLQGKAWVRDEGQGPRVQAKDMVRVCSLMLILHFNSLWTFSAVQGLMALLFWDSLSFLFHIPKFLSQF